MGIRDWARKRVKEAFWEEIDRIASDLKEGKPMNSNLKAVIEAAAFFALAAFFGALGTALADGTLTKPEIYAAIGSSCVAVAAYFKNPANAKKD